MARRNRRRPQGGWEATLYVAACRGRASYLRLEAHLHVRRQEDLDVEHHRDPSSHRIGDVAPLDELDLRKVCYYLHQVRNRRILPGPVPKRGEQVYVRYRQNEHETWLTRLLASTLSTSSLRGSPCSTPIL
jgi:hypothetical protein